MAGKIVSWRQVSFLEALAWASDKEPEEIDWPDWLGEPDEVWRSDSRPVLLSDGTYLVHADGRFWAGEPREVLP